MKKMKKLAGLLLAAVMVLAMAVTVFADTASTYKLTITDTKAGHTYEVYQIFTGDISGTSDNYVLSNVKYGENYGANVTVGDIVPEDVLEAITDADLYAQSYVPYGTAFKTVSSTAGSTEISGLPAGYYLVKDGQAVTGQDAATKFILQVVGDTSIKVKSDVPTVEKKVKENVKTVEGNADTRIPTYTLDTGYNDVADYNIGDSVPFELVGTLPSNLADYTTYKYVFHDTLSGGLTFNNDVKVYLNTVTNEISAEAYTVSTSNGLTITFDNIKSVTGVDKDSKIIVRYTARLNENAEIGLLGNTNEVYLEFSNNPNKGGEGKTGTTPEDKVIVFTYELDTTKVDGQTQAKLEGAEFKLHNSSNKWVIVDENGKVTGWAETEENGSVLTSDENGLFKVIGLDAGTYGLKETKAPTGYNLLANEISLEVIATTINNQAWAGSADAALTALQIKIGEKTENGDMETGIVNATVENNAGATLPSTGGIGTTIFYVLGSVLVIAAAILLITRKRMSARK